MNPLTDGSVFDTVTIANGATTSGAANLGKFTLNGLMLPTMTGTTITFEVSVDGSNYYALHDLNKSAVSVTCDSTARAFFLEPVKFAGFKYVRIVSNATELAERTVTLISVRAINEG